MGRCDSWVIDSFAAGGQVEGRRWIGRERSSDAPGTDLHGVLICKAERTERDAAGRVNGGAALTARAERQPVGEGRRETEAGTEHFLFAFLVALSLRRAARHSGHDGHDDVIETEHLSSAVVRVEVLVMDVVVVEVSEIASHPQTRHGHHSLLLRRRRFAAAHRRLHADGHGFLLFFLLVFFFLFFFFFRETDADTPTWINRLVASFTTVVVVVQAAASADVVVVVVVAVLVPPSDGTTTTTTISAARDPTNGSTADQVSNSADQLIQSLAFALRRRPWAGRGGDHSRFLLLVKQEQLLRRRPAPTRPRHY